MSQSAGPLQWLLEASLHSLCSFSTHQYMLACKQEKGPVRISGAYLQGAVPEPFLGSSALGKSPTHNSKWNEGRITLCFTIICPAQALATVVLTLEIATDMIALAGHLPPPTYSSCALLQQGFMLLRLCYYKHAVEPHHK